MRRTHEKDGYYLTVDLEQCKVYDDHGFSADFEIDDFLRHCMPRASISVVHISALCACDRCHEAQQAVPEESSISKIRRKSVIVENLALLEIYREVIAVLLMGPAHHSATSCSRKVTVGNPFSCSCSRRFANDGASPCENRKPASAHTACSRDDPQPKFFAAIRMLAPLCRGLVPAQMTRPCFRLVGAASRRKGILQIRLRSTRLRNCFGMIWSVSTFHPVQRRHAPPMCTKRFHRNTLSAVPLAM